MIAPIMSLRRLSLVALALLLVALAGLSGLWLWSAEQLEQGVARWADKQRERGYRISYQGPSIDGFPVQLEALFETPEVASPKGWRWSGPPVSGRSQIMAPTTIEARFPGLHRVTSEDAEMPLQAELEAASATALIDLDGRGRVESAEAALGGVALEAPKIGALLVDRLVAGFGPWKQPEAGQAATMKLAGEASGILLPDQGATPLGRKLESVELDATLHEEIPDAKPRPALVQWRDAGGKLDVHRVMFVWGPLTLEGDGTLGLDQELRPSGALKARMKGLKETIGALEAAGKLDSGQALALNLTVGALASLSSGSNDPNSPEVVLPVTLQEGRLFLGPVPLLRLDPVL
ncbi:MAG: DUF2125 domain-containing protein [Kiloniellales bacterium]|nr:DUF2125 domain-containing protein [Kiloniellales bacterium]